VISAAKGESKGGEEFGFLDAERSFSNSRMCVAVFSP
jgi:hypothetical protein